MSNQSKFRISIIVPIFNSSNNLKNLMNSIGNSKDTQIIVIDDKSEDYEVKKIKKVVSNYDNALFLQNTTDCKGAGVCRNIGIASANSEYILFADADDFFLDNWLQNIYFHIENENKSDIIFFSPTSLDIETGLLSTRHIRYQHLVDKYLNKNSQFNELRLRYGFTPPWSKLIRSELINKYSLLFDETIVSNDVNFSIKAGWYAEQITASKSSIYCVTKNSSSLTAIVTSERTRIRENVEIEKVKFLQRKMTPKEFSLLGIEQYKRSGYLKKELKKLGLPKYSIRSRIYKFFN